MSGKLLVTGRNSTKLLQLIKKAFDDMTLFIAIEIAIPRFGCVCFRRNAKGCLLRFDKAPNGQRSVGFIRQYNALSKRDLGQYVHGYRRIVGVSRCQKQMNGIADRIDYGVDFGVASAPGKSDFLFGFGIFCPFLAPAAC